MRIEHPQIDFPKDHGKTDEEIFHHAKSNLIQFIRRGWLIRETGPTIYIYSQETKYNEQYGVVCDISIEQYS